jgi:alpha-ketoglutarate-dependent taurine dioxygenase
MNLLEDGYAVIPGGDITSVRKELGVSPATPRELFAPRKHLGDDVYSAPEWAADREMCHHHEQSYSLTPPGLVLLTCLSAPESGGELLLADTSRVLDHIPGSLAERFATHGWLLTRVYRPYLGLPWTTALGVDTRDAASEWLEANGVEHSWGSDGSLSTRQKRPAIRNHPATGNPCWFNDIAFFNQWAVAPAERDVLLKTFGAEGMPFNTFAGDGTPLTELEFQALLDAYDAVGERLELRPGELLVFDNMRIAHGRTPYTGQWDLAIALGSSPPPLSV